ncbi:MAG: 2'-5' RNA ligase family protein [Bacteroidales bacterium]|nr:2'-5' RNA ligase family protein [Bacteroidales bacterium]
MALLVLGYPKIDKKDYNWIQKYRKSNDGLYFEIVEPHFTIVSPVFDFEEQDLIDEIQEKASGTSVINFELRCAMVNKDAVLDYFHVNLIPDLGFSSFIKLHNKLYKGNLAEYLRLNVCFIPHIGIGNTKDPLECKEQVDKLNEKDIRIPGMLNNLEVVKFSNSTYTSLATIPLR